MSGHAVHFASETNEWPTPAWLFALLDAEFHFNLDPCATPANAKCEMYFTRDDDGLRQQWHGFERRVFMNPPYGRDIAAWVRKAHAESMAGAVVVGLVPARTDTAWWHSHVMAAAEIRLIAGRVKFGTSTTGAPFPSVVVVWRPGCGHAPRLLTMRRTKHVQASLAEVAS